MATKTIMLEIDVEEGEETAIKELLAYLAYTKRITKYLWREKDAAGQPLNKKGPASDAKPPASKPPAALRQQDSPQIDTLLDHLAEWKKDNRLVRLKALKGMGKILDIACKIVSYDGDTGIVTVYDVDRKVVETVRLMEIEDIEQARM
ncbi:MAG: hypothetical protein K0R57_6609 [Paenibacillaceae bacterium]|nr:hypothetical protein [Paenibacillaceae bacterium]